VVGSIICVQALLTILRLNPKAESATQKISLEELKTLVLEAGHFIRKKHQTMLLNLFDLETITVDDVMVPRGQIEAIDLNAEDEVIRSQLLTCYHTRLPFTEQPWMMWSASFTSARFLIR
jgi:Mg2+/Co2+ transporter CorB